MGKGEMGTARAWKPPSLPRELRTPLVLFIIVSKTLYTFIHFRLMSISMVTWSLGQRQAKDCFAAGIARFCLKFSNK
jgi:hypothetical protein